jgi:PTH1 family peptidyl-tRNA hydrolase
MKVIVGLGNPGRQYAGTRHNVGFDVIDCLAAGPGVSAFKERFGSLAADDPADGLLLLKPQTFMNLSGRSVRQVVDFYKLPLDDLLVVCDDFALPLGKLRMRARGSHGGHNGLRSIQEHLASAAYSRLRIGVGGPESEAIDHVLGKFKPGERATMADAIGRATQAVLVWASDGVEASMNRFNGDTEPGEKKKKKPKPEGDNPPEKPQSE